MGDPAFDISTPGDGSCTIATSCPDYAAQTSIPTSYTPVDTDDEESAPSLSPTWITVIVVCLLAILAFGVSLWLRRRGTSPHDGANHANSRSSSNIFAPFKKFGQKITGKINESAIVDNGSEMHGSKEDAASQLKEATSMTVGANQPPQVSAAKTPQQSTPIRSATNTQARRVKLSKALYLAMQESEHQPVGNNQYGGNPLTFNMQGVNISPDRPAAQHRSGPVTPRSGPIYRSYGEAVRGT
ncbi:hypothetical protein SeLEV6574_g02384 [Synchytrium endobioticum]|nr:hypothetical protein SeLEV6574_g02384 [Synchytrium endobioticum]